MDKLLELAGALRLKGEEDLAQAVTEVTAKLKTLFPVVPEGKSDAYMINWIKQKSNRFQRPFINSFLRQAGYDKKKIKYLVDKAFEVEGSAQAVTAQGMDLVRDLEKRGQEIFKANPKRYSMSELTAKALFDYIYAYEKVLPQLNKAKGELDAANKAGDTKKFAEALTEFKQVAYQIWALKNKLTARRKRARLKIHTDLFLTTLNKIDFIERTIKGGERWLKDQARSPAQREAAKKASLRMQMRWGM